MDNRLVRFDSYVDNYSVRHIESPVYVNPVYVVCLREGVCETTEIVMCSGERLFIPAVVDSVRDELENG